MSKSYLIRNAQQAFDTEYTGLKHPLMQFEIAVRGSRVTHKTFARLKQYGAEYAAISQSPFRVVFKDNNDKKIKKRRSSFQIVGLSPNTLDDQAGFILPRLHLVDLEHDFINIQTRNFPIKIDAQKVDFNFIRRETVPLNYEAPDMRRGMLIALIFSSVFGEKFENADAEEYEPIFIPHSKGALVGYAHKYEDTEGKTNLEGFRGQRFINGYTRLPEPMNYQDYPACIVIKTFKPLEALNKDEQALWREMIEFIGNERQNDLHDVWGAFLGTNVPGKFEEIKEGTMQIHQDIGNIVDSQLWQKGTRRGMDHLPNAKPSVSEKNDAGLMRVLGL